tara:strand:+ start:316 stop:555 length:240 start_codon:yes stop_codon:yes gene_type:complete
MKQYSMQNLKLILKIADSVRSDLREDLDSIEDRFRNDDMEETGLSSFGSQILSDHWSSVLHLKTLTQKLIDEMEPKNES